MKKQIPYMAKQTPSRYWYELYVMALRENDFLERKVKELKKRVEFLERELERRKKNDM